MIPVAELGVLPRDFLGSKLVCPLTKEAGDEKIPFQRRADYRHYEGESGGLWPVRIDVGGYHNMLSRSDDEDLRRGV